MVLLGVVITQWSLWDEKLPRVVHSQFQLALEGRVKPSPPQKKKKHVNVMWEVVGNYFKFYLLKINGLFVTFLFDLHEGFTDTSILCVL